MDRQVDIIHPSASFEWTSCKSPPVQIIDAQAVCLNGKVYVRGGTMLNRRTDARLYIYTPTTDTWDILDTPVYGFALTIYRSQLLLVGGKEYVHENVDGQPSNRVWTLSDDGQWQETLPPMETELSVGPATSYGDHLLVINSSEVNVYNGHCWTRAQDLPERLYLVKSVVYRGHWYLMGVNNVYYASLDSLVTSCKISQPSLLWQKLPNVPGGHYPAVFGNRLVAVGPSAVYAYYSFKQSWEFLGNVPDAMYAPCAIAIPSNELLVIRGKQVLKATLKMTPLNLESPFNRKAIDSLEEAGFPLISTHHFALSCLLSVCLGDVRLTWKNLLQIIHLLQQDDLAEQVETYLTEGKLDHEVRAQRGDMESQLHLRDETIYQLKQELMSLEQKSDSDKSQLKLTIEQLRREVEELSAKTKEGDVRETTKIGMSSRWDKPEQALHWHREALAHTTMTLTDSQEAVTTTTYTETAPTATWDLRGVEVYGETTVNPRTVMMGRQFTWKGFGLKIMFPSSCLPANVRYCTVSIKASLAGQYEFPENSHLVSAVFWLRCEPMCKFTKPITVEIQHCARSGNDLNLEFVRAVCSQKQLPYTFKPLGGNFTCNSTYGVIELTSFSGLAVAQRETDDRRYYSKLFYLNNYLGGHRIDFVITWDTEAHINAVKKHYKEEGSFAGPDQPVEFEGDQIKIDLPMGETEVNKWTILPLMEPVVMKSDVDSYLPGKRIPHCELMVNPIGEPVIRLVHTVTLLGARQPRNKFTLSYMPPGVVDFTPKRSRLPLADTKPKLKDLLKEFCSTVAAKWENIGVLLGLEDGSLKNIESDYGGDCTACLREMLRSWLTQLDLDHSWSAIADALDVLGDKDLAEHIRIQYSVY